MANRFTLSFMVCLTMFLVACGGGVASEGEPTNTDPQDATKTLVSIQLTPDNPTTYIGVNEQFTAVGTYTDGSNSDITGAVNWSSENTTIAIFSESAAGLIVPNNVGTTTITAADPVTTISGSTQLKVNDVPLQSIIITPPDPIIHLGSTQLFTASGVVLGGESKDMTALVTWNSESSGVATFSESIAGLVIPGKVGSTIITAVDPATNISASTQLNVNNAVLESIVITPLDSIIRLGSNESFTAIGLYSDGDSQDLTTLAKWSSESAGVATINTKGVVTPVSIGKTGIEASYGGLAAKTTLTVKNSVYFLGESQFAQSAAGASVSSAWDPLDGSYYVAYINESDNNHAYYAKYFNARWYTFKIGGNNAPPAKKGSRVSIALTSQSELGYGHIWVAYETFNNIALVANNGYLNTSLYGSSPSIAVDPYDYPSSDYKNKVCIAYRDSLKQVVKLKCLLSESLPLSEYASRSVVNSDNGNPSNNVYLAFNSNPSYHTPFIVFDDGHKKHKTRVKFYSTASNDWLDACGQDTASYSASEGTSGETGMAFSESGTSLTVAYIEYNKAKLRLSQCKLSRNGTASGWYRSRLALTNESGISIAIDPRTQFLYISSNESGSLSLKVCTDHSDLSTCSPYPGTTKFLYQLSVAPTSYATSLVLSESGAPTVAYLDANYFISILGSPPS